MTTPDNDTSWYRIILSPEQKEFGFVAIIRAEIEEIWISRGCLEGFSIWLTEDDEQTELYFSPIAGAAAQIILYRFNGAPCPMPLLDDVTFVLGHAFIE